MAATAKRTLARGLSGHLHGRRLGGVGQRVPNPQPKWKQQRQHAVESERGQMKSRRRRPPGQRAEDHQSECGSAGAMDQTLAASRHGAEVKR